MATKVCEACGRAIVEVIETSDAPGQPFQVCFECHHRLTYGCLRPLEWYNLATIHCADGRLHMYEDGNAFGSDYEVIEPEKYPVPTFNDVKDELQSLVGYFIAWDRVIDDEHIPALLQFDAADVVDYLDNLVRSTGNSGIEMTAYAICAAIGTPAANWIRSRWNPISSSFNALCIASARCLPEGEGLQLALRYIDTLEPRAQAERATALANFRAPAVLDWIASHIELPMNKSQWGKVASSSDLDWDRTNQWLSQGRPLSLIAIEALLHIYDAHTRQWSKVQPQLLRPAPTETMIDRLERYTAQDDVPNVKNKIALICRGIRELNG